MSRQPVLCSFCGKPYSAAREIIAGPRVFICSECAQRALDLLSTPSTVQWQPPDNSCSFCGKTSTEVRRLVAACEVHAAKAQSPTICDQCMDVVVDILEERSKPLTLSPAYRAMRLDASTDYRPYAPPSSEAVDVFFEQPILGLLPESRRRAPVHTWNVAEVLHTILVAARRVGIASLDTAIKEHLARVHVKQGHISTDEIIDFADGVSAPGRRAEIETHLETCRACKAQADALKAGMAARSR